MDADKRRSKKDRDNLPTFSLGELSRIFALDPRVLDSWATRGIVECELTRAGARTFRRFGLDTVQRMAELVPFTRLGFDPSFADRLQRLMTDSGADHLLPILGTGSTRFLFIERKSNGIFRAVLFGQGATVSAGFGVVGSAAVIAVNLEALKASIAEANRTAVEIARAAR